MTNICISRTKSPAFDRFKELHVIFSAEHHRQRKRLLGHVDVVWRPSLHECHLVEKAQGGRRDSNVGSLELPDLTAVNLEGATLLGAEFVGRLVKEFRAHADLLQVRKLCVLGEVADSHVFEHALA